MPMITIFGCICEMKGDDKDTMENLIKKFSNARRRSYSLKWKGVPKSVIEKSLQEETGLNSRYVRSAYHSIKGLPPHVTFGGIRSQWLRESGKITKEEYERQRNSVLISYGSKEKKGNLNLRLSLEKMSLRVNIGKSRKWLYLKIFIPRKYLDRYGHLLDGSRPYAIYIKRRNDDKFFDFRISVDVPVDVKEGKGVMALDMNAGHTDFCVMDKRTREIIAVGKINHHETQFVKRHKSEYLLHKTINKIGNIAKHYNADVVVGKLNTGKFRSKNKKANRKIRNMPQYKFRQYLKKLNRRGTVVKELSEAYTTKMGKMLMLSLGLDIHKASAVAFAIKVIDYNFFRELMDSLSVVSLYEGNGSSRREQRKGSGLTVPYQSNRLVSDEAQIRTSGNYSIIPDSRGLSLLDNLNTSFACLQIEVC